MLQMLLDFIYMHIDLCDFQIPLADFNVQQNTITL